MTDLTARITEILHTSIEGVGGERLHLGFNGRRLSDTKIAEHFATKIAAAAEEHYRQELGWTVEREHPVPCVCGHPKVDHAHAPTDGRTGIQIANCIANRGTRRTNCDCGQWEPVERTRLVTAWSPGAGE